MKNKGYERRKEKRLRFFIKTAKKFGVLVYQARWRKMQQPKPKILLISFSGGRTSAYMTYQILSGSLKY